MIVVAGREVGIRIAVLPLPAGAPGALRITGVVVPLTCVPLRALGEASDDVVAPGVLSIRQARNGESAKTVLW